MEIRNLPDAEFKTLVIRSLKELIEYCTSIKKTQAEMKVSLSEVKKNIKRELKRKEKASNQNSKKKKELKKNEGRLRSLWDISKCTSIQILGVPEGEEGEQELEKITKEKFSNLVKEIHIQVQEAQRVPNKLHPKKDHTKAHHN